MLRWEIGRAKIEAGEQMAVLPLFYVSDCNAIGK